MLSGPVGSGTARRAGYRGAVSSARDLIAALLFVLGAVCGALWLPSMWLADNVVEQDGFLAITEPLSADTALQRELSDAAVTEILSDDRIPGWLADTLEPIAQDKAAELTRGAGYAEVWSATTSDLHTGLTTPGESTLEADVAPMVDELLTGIDEHLPLGLTIPRPESVPVPLATVPDLPWMARVLVLAPHVEWLGIAAGVLLLLGLVVAAHRRAMLALAGVMVALAGGAVWLLTQRLEQLVPDAIDQADFIGPIVQVFETRMAADLVPQVVLLVGAGALLATIGLVAVGVGPRRVD